MKAIIIVLSLLGLSTGARFEDFEINSGWRVVGGSTAKPGQFPFIISLRAGGNSHICGGSIIAKDWVVTAAHCVAGGQPPAYTVVAGSNQLDSPNATRIAVQKIIVHPDWNPSLITNDVALLKLATPIRESEFIQIISLESQNVDAVRNCTLIGWGRTSYPGSIPNDLQFLDLVSLPFTECKDRWASINPVYPTEICTFTKSGEGACHGDSGGPLIDETKKNPVLIALVSWGSPCARGMPDVYTRVSSFYQWITKTITN
ncbi:chymotrypsin-like proteinase 5B precursor precursor [Tribolium castaneum]|uniref:Chymotrypsin-like proteinase 5B n=1 Tax=Tribolium castaneum TaxID=7070 RepID=D0R8Q9_TRICA|nr:chymotrypsin-like proteinase 5B precursor precursor [Tribolium castaneum]EFA04659.1 serine protease P147 [Tribolium castaneum]CBC01166.1 chymotrypsin-like proteinase 5B precursor [Tribolium castaneum]|eukprot:NP_001161129.1 uncharacterized protein LOC656185 precursor [Tribolium castaneum]